MSGAADSAAERSPLFHRPPGRLAATGAALAERGPAIAGFAIPFALVLYLGLKGGGYDLVIYSEAGIAIWWLVLCGALVGLLPAVTVPRAGWVGLGLLAALAVWTGLGIGWSESAERSAAELGRIAAYLGVLALAVTATGREGLRRTVNGVAAAIGLLGLLAALSRLHPSWFPVDDAAAGLPETRARLNYPLNYWNGLAALIAIGAPLVLVAGRQARSTLARALSVAVLPAMMLATFLTLSRGGAIALAAALALLFALYPQRLALAAPAAVAGVASLILVAAVDQRNALQDGLAGAGARAEGDEMLAMLLVVCAGAGLLGAAISLAARHGIGPRPRIEVRHGALAALAVAVVGLVLAIAAGAPGELADRWEEFKQPVDPGGGAARLESTAGNGRYQAWQAALDANATDPLVGIGPGTFEYFWAREGTVALFLRDAHSLYLETLAELGIVGLALLLALVATLAVAGTRLLRSGLDPGRRGYAAAALAACGAFLVAALYDWAWDLPVLAIAFLLLAGTLLGTPASAPRPLAGGRAAGSPRPARAARIALAAGSVAALAAIAIPLASTVLVRESQAQARAAALPGALADARDAHDVEPFAAGPLLQQALVLELTGDLEGAVAAAERATAEEPTNWRTWLVLSRLEAKAGDALGAVEAYREARSLNPRSPLFR